MKHIAKIQTEYLKTAKQWNKLTIDEQKAYLKKHPNSKKHLNGKKKSQSKITEKSTDQITDQMAEQEAKLLVPKLTTEELSAIDNYQQYEYEFVNPQLRGTYYLNSFVKEQIKLLDSIFDKAPLTTKPLILTRKVESKKFLPKKGENFTEQSFMSTSYNDKSSFKTKGNKSYTLKIIVPEKSKVLFLSDKLARKTRDNTVTIEKNLREKGKSDKEIEEVLDGLRITSEREALLPRGSTFKNIGKDKDGNIILQLLSDENQSEKNRQYLESLECRA